MPGQTAAERSRKYRDKINADPDRAQQKRLEDAKRMQIYRERVNKEMQRDAAFAEAIRAARRARAANYRRKRKAQDNPMAPVYKSEKSLKMALRKVELALPKNMDKRNEIIKVLAEKYLTNVTENQQETENADYEEYWSNVTADQTESSDYKEIEWKVEVDDSYILP